MHAAEAVTVHGAVRAPRPATLPQVASQRPVGSNRQRCGEGLGEGKPGKTLCLAPLARERLPEAKQAIVGREGRDYTRRNS